MTTNDLDPDHASATQEKLVDIETKLAWHDDKLEVLNSALVEKERRITALEDRIDRLERALQILAQRSSAGTQEVAGAHDVDDPVPRSG